MNQQYRRILYLALMINATMFLVEIIASQTANSLSLLADSLDFLGDAANYGLSLWVLEKQLHRRAKASLLKAATMATFGIWILGSTLWNIFFGELPHAATMGAVGILALICNVSVAALLYAYREGDSNRRSVWICSRNDALGNIAVVIAAVGVFGTGSAWPDLIVAVIFSGLALTGAWQIARHARAELATHS